MTTELAFVAALRALATDPAARGLDDDCAVLELGGEALVLTHDMMVAGVHFLADQDPADVAWKLVATNLSDLAAKGAAPLGVLLGYQLSGDDGRFVAGLGEALAHYAVPLLGGDTVGRGADGRTGPQVLGLTALGRATHRPVPARSGARPGDGVWLTGALGAAMTGLEALRSGSGDSTRYRRPVARVGDGIALAPHVTAMMDVSDGLLLDALRMARASGVSLVLDRARIPLACPPARGDEALRWGDDYELLFTLPGDVEAPVDATRIGTVSDSPPGSVVLDGKILTTAAGLGFEHR